MNALLLTLFVSLGLAALAVVSFAWRAARGEHEHGTRLSLLPLEDDND